MSGKGQVGRRGLAAELEAMLAPRFSGVRVEVASNPRWDRPGIGVTWAGFAGLLPEERFQRIMSVIPTRYFDQHLRGYVWLELAEGEEVDDFLALPRSEDVAGRESAIYARLNQVHAFELLGKALGASPERNCAGNFARLTKVLSKRHISEQDICEAKLAFIRCGCYCDCQALRSGREALAKFQVKKARRRSG